MFSKIIFALFCISLLAAYSGCSQAVDAELTQPQTIDGNSINADSPQVWGLWDVSISPEGVIDVIPQHSADFTINTTAMFTTPPVGMSISFIGIDFPPGYKEFTVDVSLTHHFIAGSRYTAFDMCCVLMGIGDTAHPSDPGLMYAGPGEIQLMNQDGYTRWMNRVEFNGTTPPCFGYKPGSLGTPGFDPTSTLNPYKFYCDSIGTVDNAHDYLVANPSDRGMFSEGATNTRRFVIRIPDTKTLMFQYAVIVRWQNNVMHPAPPVNIPDDFPEGANAIEAVALKVINDTSDMWFESGVGGGNFTAEVSVINWHAEPFGGVMSEYDMHLYSDAWAGGVMPSMTVLNDGDNYCTFNVDIPATPTASGSIDIWIELAHPNLTFANPAGVPTGADNEMLTAHFTYSTNVSDEAPDPEFWEPPTDHDPRFLFIHHSCGSGFLFTGGMWGMLEAAGFEVHNRTYGDGWVGDNTNPNHWPITFTQYYDDMINWELGPGEYYDIVAFKSCYPACNISSDAMLEAYYGYYATVKGVTQQHPETLFIPWSPPPLNPASTNPANAARARIFANWLVSPYCDNEFNMRSFDCFDVLAGDDPLSGDFNMLKYEYSDGTNSHPNTPGDIAVATAFTAFLTDLVWD